MKKLLIVVAVIALVCATGTVQAKDWKLVRIGVEGAYPPFSYTTVDGRLDGFDIDIARALGKAMEVEIKLVPQDWERIIPALLTRKYDAIIASIPITEERKKKVAFTHKYYHTPAKFVCKKGTMKAFTREQVVEATAGRIVGVQRATNHDSFITDNGGESVVIRRYASLEEAYMDLVAGRMDMLLADSVAIDRGFLRKSEGKDYQFIGPDLMDKKWFGEGVGIACRKQDHDLVERFNKAIAQIRSDGTYKNIQDKYFDFNVYGE